MLVLWVYCIIRKSKQDGHAVSENLLDNSSAAMRLTSPKSSNDDEQESGCEFDALNEVVEESSLETELERKLRKKSHLVVYATAFILSVGFSIILTGVWPYLKELDPSASKEFLGWVVASTSLGQMIASPVLSYWGTKAGSNRNSFILSVVMFIIGNILYGLLPLFNHEAKYIMLFSRFIIGVSSGNVALCRSYISVSTKMSERTVALAVVAAAQSMGFILGPSIQTALIYMFPINHPKGSNHSDFNITNFNANGTSLNEESSFSDAFNMYSLTGWVTAVLGILNLFIFLPCVYQEFNIAINEERSHVANGINDVRQISETNYFALGVVLFGYFTFLMTFVLVETILVPMCLDLYAWTPEFAVKVVGVGLTIAGIITVFVFILSGKLAKVFGDRKVFILCGILPLTLSTLFFFPVTGPTPKIKDCSSLSIHNSSSPVTNVTGDFSEANAVIGDPVVDKSLRRVRRAAFIDDDEYCSDLGCPVFQKWCAYTPIIHLPQLGIACTLTTIGYATCVSLTGAIFSKMLRVKKQGLWMGILTSVGSFARCVGPIFVSYVYTAKGPLWTFGSLFLIQLSVLILNVVFYKKMAPLLTTTTKPSS